MWKGAELQRLTTLLQQLLAQLAELEAEEEAAAAERGGSGVLALKSRMDERRALEARIKKIERGLPQPGAPTVEVPGPWQARTQ